MTSLTDIDGSVFAYEFDGEGNRLSQSLNDCLSKRFVYDGADVLLELNPTNGVAYAWVNGPGIDQPIERLLFIDGATRARRVFHADALGSIAALTEATLPPRPTAKPPFRLRLRVTGGRLDAWLDGAPVFENLPLPDEAAAFCRSPLDPAFGSPWLRLRETLHIDRIRFRRASDIVADRSTVLSK